MILTDAKFTNAANSRVTAKMGNSHIDFPVKDLPYYEKKTGGSILVAAYINKLDLTLDDVRKKRNEAIQAIMGYYNPIVPVGLPTNTTQDQWNSYLKDLRNLPSTIDLTGVKTHEAMLAKFPVKPT